MHAPRWGAPSQSAAAAVSVTALYVVSMLSADAVARKHWPGRGALKILYAHQLFWESFTTKFELHSTFNIMEMHSHSISDDRNIMLM